MPAPLVILCAFNGRRVFEVGDGRHILDDDGYLVLNGGQQCISYQTSNDLAESFSVFFWPGFAEKILRDCVTPVDCLLDEPQPSGRSRVQFVEKLYPHDAIVSPLLMDLRRRVNAETVTHGWLEERNHKLICALLCAHRNLRDEIDTLPGARHTTRMELYRRLARARDFMEASLGEAVTLNEIAEIAWFSPHHFLRVFKQAFHETPHQYLTRRRLEIAQKLLQTTNLPITDICFEVGFESLGSFSWLFRQRVGLSPEAYRKQHHNPQIAGGIPDTRFAPAQ